MPPAAWTALPKFSMLVMNWATEMPEVDFWSLWPNYTIISAVFRGNARTRVAYLDCDIRRVLRLVCVHCGDDFCPVSFCNKRCGCRATVAEVGANGAVLERRQEAITPSYDMLEL